MIKYMNEILHCFDLRIASDLHSPSEAIMHMVYLHEQIHQSEIEHLDD